MLFSLLLLACTGSGSEQNGAPKSSEKMVYSLSFPVQFLVQSVGAGVVTSNCVLPIGEDAAHWTPSPETISTLQQADLIVANGAGFEAWTKTASLPMSKGIELSSSLELIQTEGGTHSHGKGGEHSHGEVDPHTWADPLLYKEQALQVHEALIGLFPQETDKLDKNLKALQEEITSLSVRYKEALAPLKEIKLASNHPSYAYLARSYGLDIYSFDFDPSSPPQSAALAKFAIWSSGMQKPVLLWEDEPADTAKSVFPEYTLHVYIDPLEQPKDGQSYDYLVQAEQNIQRFKTLTEQLEEPNAQ